MTQHIGAVKLLKWGCRIFQEGLYNAELAYNVNVTFLLAFIEWSGNAGMEDYGLGQ